MLLKADTSQLLIVDIQARLLPAMHEAEALSRQAVIVATAAAQLGVPMTISEHCADKIGTTVTEVASAAKGARILPKSSFSCLADEGLASHLATHAGESRRQLVILGIEAHVCVLQSALAALNAGYDVFVVTDAVTSRRAQSCEVALSRIVQAGIVPVTTEMVLFEWLERAGTPAFKTVSALIR